MLMLVIGNIAQVVIWAFLFRLLGEFSRFGEAVYHSAVNSATLGYGDISPITPLARNLAWCEAMVGQLFVAITIARLVGLHIAHSGENRDA